MPHQITSSNSNSYCENKCRACMTEGGKMLSMYDDKSTNKINLSYKLAELTSIQVNKLFLLDIYFYFKISIFYDIELIPLDNKINAHLTSTIIFIDTVKRDKHIRCRYINGNITIEILTSHI